MNMAGRKRKSSRKTSRARKEAPVEHELPGGFWRQIMGILMIAIALFFVITWFSEDKSTLNMVHRTILSWLGVAAYFLPPLLVYLAVKKLRSENNKVAIPVYLASILMIIWIEMYFWVKIDLTKDFGINI